MGNLYYLENSQQPNAVKKERKERLWHRRYWHLSEHSLQKLAQKGLVNCNATNDIDYCKVCIGGKHHRRPARAIQRTLELVHSDVCGKMSVKLIGGAEYLLTFTDGKTHYTWVYPLKMKDQVFDHFLEWKALVENSSGKKLKTLHSDNGGEYSFTVKTKVCMAHQICSIHTPNTKLVCVQSIFGVPYTLLFLQC